jgi:hypothetical protein
MEERLRIAIRVPELDKSMRSTVVGAEGQR